MKAESKRIGLLDTFRFLAILLVLLYHYLYRFATVKALYPYGNSFSDFFLARYGYTGVQFFFIISGFVILLTLEKSASIKEFLIKRFIRLFPMLLVCSLATFTLVRIIDQTQQFPYFQKTPLSFLPSLTFTDPALWQRFVNPDINSFVDGVYWSLAVEVKFYLLAGIVYFAQRRNFWDNWLKLLTAVMLIHYAVILNNTVLHFSDLLSKLDAFFDIIFLPEHILYFCIGMFFYNLHAGRKIRIVHLSLISIFVLAEEVIFLKGVERSFLAAFIALFFIFVFKPNWLGFLSNRLFQTIGLVSYPLYLLHQNLGVLSIYKLGVLLGDSRGVLSLLAVTTAIIILSYLVHTYLDQPAQKYLRNVLLSRKRKAEALPKAERADLKEMLGS